MSDDTPQTEMLALPAPPKRMSPLQHWRLPAVALALCVLVLASVYLLMSRQMRALQTELDQQNEQQQQLAASVSGEQRAVESLVQQRLSEAEQALRGQLQRGLEQTQAHNQQLQSHAGQLQTLQQQSASGQERQLELSQRLQMLEQRVDGQQQRLSNLSTTSREDWLLAEAEYLLRLANQRVLLERTTDNAVALLRAADRLVQQVAAGLGDAELFAIRQALARELSALAQIPPLDKEGVYLQLQSLADSVASLPRLPQSGFDRASPSDEAAEGDIAAEESAEPWRQRLRRGLGDLVRGLGQFVKIDRVDGPVAPLADSQAAQLAALNIRLLLQQAQSALLRDQGELYRSSLAAAEQMLVQNYIQSSQRDHLQQQLQAVAEAPVAQALPDISQSLRLLHDYTAQLHRLQPAAEGQL